MERFPAAFLDERALEIRLLADHRSDLVAERTRMINRLRWHLVDICPELEASIPARHLDSRVTLERIARRLRREERTARVRVALELVASIRRISRTAAELERELHSLITVYRPALLGEQGLGVITAATLIGRTAGAERFPTDSHFARQAGVAPIPVSSGRKDRHRLHRGGDRQLNRALHTIADAPASTRRPAPTWSASAPRARATERPCAASSATSPDTSTASSRCPRPTTSTGK